MCRAMALDRLLVCYSEACILLLVMLRVIR